MPMHYTVGDPIPLVRSLPNNTLQHYLRIPITTASGQTYHVEVPAEGDVVAAATQAIQAKVAQLESILALSSS